MADKNRNPNQYHPPESNGYHRSDQESLEALEEAKRKKRMKWTIGIIAFIIFQVVQALFFILVIMKFKAPKFRVTEFETQVLNTTITPSPGFNMRFDAPIRVKNTNWGPFKYGASIVDFTYENVSVGSATIPKGKANFKSTKKINVPVELSSTALPSTSTLGSNLTNGVITLKSTGQLSGKVTVMFMFKKKKTSKMDCTITIDVNKRDVRSSVCV